VRDGRTVRRGARAFYWLLYLGTGSAQRRDLGRHGTEHGS